jgi:hypothetical protein
MVAVRWRRLGSTHADCLATASDVLSSESGGVAGLNCGPGVVRVAGGVGGVRMIRRASWLGRPVGSPVSSQLPPAGGAKAPGRPRCRGRHATPSLRVVPEERQQPTVDAVEQRDRLRQRKPVGATDDALEDRRVHLRVERQAGGESAIEQRRLRLRQRGPANLVSDSDGPSSLSQGRSTSPPPNSSILVSSDSRTSARSRRGVSAARGDRAAPPRDDRRPRYPVEPR